MDVVRITELQPKTYVEQGDYIAIDNQSDGTKKVQFTNLLDDSLSTQNKAADASATGQAISGLNTNINDVNTRIDDANTRIDNADARIDNLINSGYTFKTIDTALTFYQSSMNQHWVASGSIPVTIDGTKIYDFVLVDAREGYIQDGTFTGSDDGVQITMPIASSQTDMQYFVDTGTSHYTGHYLRVVIAVGMIIDANAEITDARIVDGVTYSTLGDAIRTSVDNLETSIDNLGKSIYDVEDNSVFKASNYLIIRNIDNGKYWSNSDGTKGDAPTYSCSHNLIAVDPEEVAGQMLISENNQNMYITCFDASKQLIDYHQIFGKIARGNSSAIPNYAIPNDTYYIGVSIRDNPTATEMVVRMLENVAVVEYPYNNSNLIYLTNKWRSGQGAYGNVNNYDCVVIPSVKEGDKYYTNAIGDVIFQFFSSDSTAPLSASVEDVPNFAKIFTAPVNSCYAVMNIPHSRYHGSTTQYSTVAYKLTKNQSILTIGDSITWLDNKSDPEHLDGATTFLGYQKQINREGYKVVDFGFSGYTYAKDVMDESTPIGSIYNEVVTNQYDVSDYDYIVLAGGTNDDLYAVTVGTVPNEYQHEYTDAELKTTIGALGAIIDYIRENNPTAKIVLCTQNKSQATRRPYSEAVQYADGIRGMAKYASCYLCDLFENMNAQPYTDSFTQYYYDSTHPNKAGMVRMGQQILHAIENA